MNAIKDVCSISNAYYFHLGKILTGPRIFYNNTGPNSFGTDAVAAIYLGKCTYKGSTNCGIPQSQIGEHGVSSENMKNMRNVDNTEKMENNITPYLSTR